jgi:hypothetical protein
MKRVVGYFLSVASVYLTMTYMINVFLNLISNFTFTVV